MLVSTLVVLLTGFGHGVSLLAVARFCNVVPTGKSLLVEITIVQLSSAPALTVGIATGGQRIEVRPVCKQPPTSATMTLGGSASCTWTLTAVEERHYAARARS